MDEMTGAPSIDSTFGALLIASFLSIILYGFGIHQFYRYMRLFPSDALSIRVVVFSLAILATFQTVINCHANYYYLVSNYFFPSVLQKTVWSANLTPVVSALTTIIAQAFFARRVALIGWKFQILAIISVIILGGRLAAEIVLTVKSFTTGSASAYTNDVWVIALTCATSTAADIILSGCVFSVLWSSRSKRPRDRETNESKFNVAVTYTVNTGLLIFLFDFISLICAITRPHDFYWLSFNILGTRVALNTLFCVLNSRKVLANGGVEIFQDGGSFGASLIARANRIATVERWNVPQGPDEVPPAMIDVKVTREIEGTETIEMSLTRQEKKARAAGKM